MEKIKLSQYNKIALLSVSETPTECTCYACAGCVWCIVFPPAVGVGLSVSLGVGLVAERNL